MRLHLLLTALVLLPFVAYAYGPTPANTPDLPSAAQEHEAAAIAICRAYYRAQLDYAREDRNGDAIREYARNFRGVRDQRSGLHLAVVAGSTPNGSSFDGRKPYHGYRYKILTRQGGHAPGGRRDYLVGEHLVGGFALLAWPVKYGFSGRHTFLVNQSGRILQKDLGPSTAKIAKQTTAYDPDATWTPVP